MTVISHAGLVALAPAPDPASNVLAWVGETCTPSSATASGEASATLYVSDLATETTRDLGAYAGQVSDNEIAWSSDGKRLVVQDGSTMKAYDIDQASMQGAVSLEEPSECRLTNPAFFPGTDKLAVIRTCESSGGRLRSSDAVVFTLPTRRPVALIATAPSGSFFRGLSIDSSGAHILLGVIGQVRGSPGGEDVQLENGQLVAVSREAPSDAQW